ncbi:uncharacterized protein LACBIDRAFT_298739 [Laccaria bicolor S238N-H82]|uniref:Predicted protein n=1 Tax=Laccaria bicolor (strain S238N-H82 / ATCC MYA-4686) TaxID=486041 RepID=B0DDI1_LACBS|nr:uncharacterized protein LACBIDRAFT_298739 [Laccaria bicolor S238N-H82]EDR07478.1 predicted protein [Laccaria bicolor S238N-H82]|eukprot:XP_001881870.1 predicted protein [Laccaria bicolor S238N-H82]
MFLTRKQKKNKELSKDIFRVFQCRLSCHVSSSSSLRFTFTSHAISPWARCGLSAGYGMWEYDKVGKGTIEGRELFGVVDPAHSHWELMCGSWFEANSPKCFPPQNSRNHLTPPQCNFACTRLQIIQTIPLQSKVLPLCEAMAQATAQGFMHAL